MVSPLKGISPSLPLRARKNRVGPARQDQCRSQGNTPVWGSEGKTVESLRHMSISCQLPGVGNWEPNLNLRENLSAPNSPACPPYGQDNLWKFLIQIQHSQFCATNPKDQVVSSSNASSLNFLSLWPLVFFLFCFSSVHKPRQNAPNPCPTHSCLKICRSGSLIDSITQELLAFNSQGSDILKILQWKNVCT